MSEMNKYDVVLKSAINKINELNEQLKKQESDIAVIGYDCRFPGGADNSELYWKLMLQGYDAISEAIRYDMNEYYDSEKGVIGKTYTKEGGFLEQDIRAFDNIHFETSEQEAISIDPQHRLLLEVSWGALENAGLNISKLSGSNTGVFLAMDGLEYCQAEFLTDDVNNINRYSLMGVSQHSAAGRIAYYYNFKGPAYICNTACSSSLVAINNAVESLKRKQCDMAIVGGVNLLLSPATFVALSQIQALSPDGRCKAFDASADGYGRGEGCGVLILKRLEDAEADGNNIEAVIKGSCVGQDGKSNGLFAPNGLAQQRIMKDALQQSRLKVDDIDYIETHGTGTILGDYIESQSICEVYKNRKDKLWIGSVKSCIGHLEAAAGMAGVIKLLLCFRHGKIPPSIHFDNPNPRVDWTKLQYIDKAMDWDRKDHIRSAAINSFGITGTLANIILSEYEKPEKETYEHVMQTHILTVSAKNEDSLKEYLKLVDNEISKNENDIKDIVYSLNTTRSYQKYRFAVTGCNKDELQEKLRRGIEEHEYYTENSGKADKIKIGLELPDYSTFETLDVFRGLYKNVQAFTVAFDEVFSKFDAQWEDISKSDLWEEKQCSGNAVALRQATVFSGECAYVKLLDSLGIKPLTVRGIGVGSKVKAVIAGKKKLDDVIASFRTFETEDDQTIDSFEDMTWLLIGGSFEQFIHELRKLYLKGACVNWGVLYKGYNVKTILCPNYAFQKKILWKSFNCLNKSHKDDKAHGEEGEKMNRAIVGSSVDYRKEICDIIFALSGISANKIDYDEDLIAYGFDSLLLMNFAEKLKEKFHVEISIDSFFSSLNTVNSIGAFLENNVHIISETIQESVDETVKEDADAENTSFSALPENIVTHGNDVSVLSDLFNKQFEIMRQQNNLMQQYMHGSAKISVSANKEYEKLAAKNVAKNSVTKEVKQDFYVPYHAIDTGDHAGLTESQYKYVKKIEEIYTSRTITSKNKTQQYRTVYANARNVAGFTKLTKEMSYQIIVKQAKGSKVIDLDNNEYIDITMGFGVDLLGHAPDMIQDVLRKEIDRGYPLGPMEDLPGQVAKSITELTHTDRVFFCNSGTEADMVAMRLARAYTGKSKIVCFAGSYHGSSDGVLGISGLDETGEYKTLPMVPGVGENAVKDLVVLVYASEESLTYIEEHADEIAGVLVEPVQSRKPDLQPREYLHKLRELTKKSGIILIFDEVITGFRIGAGGSQEFFGIEADICTYGKIMGGGMPIGVVAGKATYMDCVDGGMWQFGDDSVPTVNDRRTLATGTFCHHGLAMAATKTMLEYIENNKEWMYKELNDKTNGLVNCLNDMFVEYGAPFRVVNFGSLFRFTNVMYYKQDIFFYSLVAKGLYIWEGRNCFLSIAHSNEDIEKIFRIVKQTVAEMKEAGFFGKGPDKGPNKDEQDKGDYISKVDTAPMSVIQKRLYTDIQFTGIDRYDMVSAYYITGNIDIDKLEDAYDKVVQRHEVLRTALVIENGEFVQKIQKIEKAKIRRLRVDENEDVNQTISRCLTKFELKEAPLMEAVYAQLPEDKKLLIFHFHHSVADGSSTENFIKEIGTFYAGGILSPLKKQYRDYVEWERRYLSSEVYVADRLFWKSKSLETYDELNIPRDSDIRTRKTYECGTVANVIDKDTVAKLTAYGRSKNSSMFMTLLGAVNLLLHKLSYQNDIVVKTPVTNMYESGFQENIGMFTNTVLLANTIDVKSSIDKFIETVKKNCLEIYRHMNYPYSEVIADMNKSNSQAFRTTFIYEKTDVREIKQKDMSLEQIAFQPDTIEDDIKMEFMEHDGIIEVYFRYAKEYFGKATVQRYLDYFIKIISVIASTANERIENLDVISSKEKELICDVFNSPAVISNDNRLIYQMFQEHALEEPQNIALIMKGRTLSFEKMNRMVNVLAHKLREMGVERQDKVIIIGDRTVEFILAIIGVMKAGAAYVPVDPQWPEHRTEYVVKDSEAKIALLASKDAKPLEYITSIDLYEENAWNGDESEPETINDAEDLAYCIYTSGTTGDAKGVMIKHKALVNYVLYFKELCNIRKCVVPLFTNCSFDLAGTAIYLSVFCGNALEIFDSHENTDLAKLITDEKYDCLKMTPSHLKIAIEQTGSQKASPDKHIITGGEKLESDIVDRLFNRFGEVKLINEYGPTEATIAVTYHVCDEEDRYSQIPIGRPIDNVQIYILNGNKLCGVGIPGEICIAGECLARGYINKPELTLTKFEYNPFGEGELYHTGDLGKWRSDGQIDYIGRTDQQVKIRGFRIELSAIESVIRSAKNVDDCVVAKKITDNQQEILVAYVVANTPVMLTKIQKLVSEQLPEYMVPNAMVELDKIPLTANGKIDYRALPSVNLETKKAYVAPQNDLEQELAELFGYVLKQEKIGTQDNFFECGGNSLNATILLNLITEKLNADISLRTIFANPTVTRLATVIKDKGKLQEQESRTVISDEKIYEMSSAQKRLYMVWQMEPQSTAYNMPGVIKIEGDIDADRLKNAFGELIKRHEITRTKFGMINDELYQIIEEQIEPDFIVNHDVSISKEELFTEFDKPFDLNAGPLMRIRLYRRNDGYLLLFVMHHIIGDGMSHYLLIKELCDLYNGKTLKPLTWQYRDYSEWMKQRDFSKQKRFWLDKFSAGVPVLDFPYDYSIANGSAGKADIVEAYVSEDICKKMTHVMKENAMTEYMLTLAAFMILLGRYSRQDEVILGTVAAGRTHLATTDMLGMFVNTLTLTGNPALERKVEHFWEEVKDTCMDVFENQEYPFEELVRNLGIQRNNSSNPLFDIMYVFQNNDTTEVELDGVVAKTVDYANKNAKFNITFTVFKEKNGLKLEMEYRTDRLKKENAELFVRHYLNILKNMLDNPLSQIQQIEEIDDVEKNTVINEFNLTNEPYPKDKTIGRLFDEQAEAYPNKAAVIQGERSISYSELKRRSNALANILQREGVTNDDPVVIFAEKSIEAILGVLAIIKAGGAYVPIEASMPEERIRFMVHDSNPKVVLTYHADVEIKDRKVIDLEKIVWDEIVDESPLAIVNSSDSLAYIIYTSGTTGNPKGAMIEQKSVIRLVKNGGFATLDDELVILETGQLSFDASTLEIWGSLLNGGQLVITDNDTLLDSKRLKDEIKNKNVNFMWLTSTLFNQMFMADEHIFDSLQCLMVGGEQLSEKHVRMFKEIKNNVRLVNGYGPTENTTFTTTYEIPDRFDTIPIGKPISNTKVFVLNGEKLCGIGIPGELCTSGDGVSRGYLNNKKLTEEKFVKNPYGSGKMYRTGDLVRWMPDGNIEFMGRIDEQVKIRGYRIELEDIRTTIESFKEVKECAVVVLKDEQGEKAIVAYVVLKNEDDLNLVRDKAKKKLPKYMLPAHFMQIDKIPVTRNGKLDKRLLPDVVITRTSDYVAPVNDCQKVLCSIYQEMLGVDRVGITDNFFELGGHSLKATGLVNRIDESLGIRLSLSTVFEYQTVEELSSVIEHESGNDNEVFRKAETKEFYPMSSAQKRLYFMWQLEPESTWYNMPACIHLKGEVDKEHIENALNGMIERHELLRTSFVMKNGEPVQKIREDVHVTVEYIENTREKDEKLKRDFVRPFDLENDMLVRMLLVKRKNEFVLLIDMHHIICDGFSLKIFKDEFIKLYKGQALEPLAFQYKDYSEWNKHRNLRREETYWLSEFSDEIPVLDLVTDYERGLQRGILRNTVHGLIGTELKEQLRELADKYKVTPYMIYLSAVMILMSKYANQEDVVIGSPVSGRVNVETEKMMGMFVNILAMRGKPSSDKKFEQFLKEVKTTSIKAFENQEYPYEELVQKVVKERDFSRNPLFDVMLVLQNFNKSEEVLDRVDVEEDYYEQQEAKYDCTFTIMDEGDKDVLHLEYCSELFKQETMEAMKEHFIYVLEQIVKHPKLRIGEITTSTNAEKEQILHKFNAPLNKKYVFRTMVELFEEQVMKAPDKTAIICKEQKLTYKELDEKANMLGTYLRSKGIKQDNFVVVMLEKGISNIVAILGVLKSGAAFVPIDTDCPRDRVRYILDDCKPEMIITEAVDLETDRPVLSLKDENIWNSATDTPKQVNKPDSLAYMIYTSGTTGKPKGVMVEHSGIGNLRDYFIKEQGITQEDIVLQFASPAFDAMISELCMSILSGACLCIATKDEIQDYRLFEEFNFKNNVSIGIIPPQYLSALDKLPFRTIITAGSETNWDLVKRFGKDRVYSNDYGPTEVTVCATFNKITGLHNSSERVPIGKPINNKNVFILQGNELCGIGVPGELCVAGIGIAQGYLNMPDLTKEKFIKNPFGNGKLYRTGDKARWLANGDIEFLGRIDTQVKIRGYRIELGEVENAIRKVDAISDCVVIAHKDASGDKELHAFYVANDIVEQSVVKEIIAETLPTYMIPAYLMQIDNIPLNSNGKLDVRELLKMENDNSDPYSEPENEMEKKICICYENVLGRERVGRNDNFFYIGGHSLRATALVNAIEKFTGCKLMIKDIFENPTPVSLANLLESNESKMCEAISVAEKQDTYEMSYAQKRIYLISQMSENKTSYNMPGCIRMVGNVDAVKMEKALRRVVERHEILRTGFELIESKPIQRIYEDAIPEFVYEENDSISEKEALIDFVKPFDLAKAPLVRMKVLKRKNDYLLFYDMHHLVGDGLSMANFVEELGQLYNGNDLPDMELQYKDYSEWLRRQDMSGQEKYWMEQFEDSIPVLDIPTDYKRPMVQSYEGSKVENLLDEQTTRNIQSFANQNGVTVYMLFLATAMILLGKYSRQDDIVIGSAISGRIQKETESMLGMFVNTLAMRGKPEKNKTFMQLLSEVKETCMNAYENQTYPFEELVDRLGIERDLSRNPLFDVMLTVQNNENVNVELNGISTQMMAEDLSVAKFDLTILIEMIGGRLRVVFEYCTKLYHEDTVIRMLEQYLYIIQQVMNDSQIKIADIETALKQEREKLLTEFNDTDVPYPENKTIDDLFMEQVEKHHDKVSVVFEDKRLTYQELNERALRLCTRLQKNGVGRGDFVAILTEKSLEVVVGILAIIKAGAAYVPIDANTPADRLEYILNDAEPKVVLTNGMKLDTKFPVIDLTDQTVWEEVISTAVVEASPDDNAYIIYTSGTTGKPKGVIIDQTNIITLVKGADYTDISEDMVVMQTGELSFDASTFEIWGSLLNGGTVHLAPKLLLLDCQAFKKYLIDNKITTMFITTALFNQLLSADESVFDSLDSLMFGGEKAAEDYIQTVQRRGKIRDFRNVYGPTETTTFATSFRITDEIRQKTPIGKPVSNTKLYVMDQDKLCGIGVCGELCIAGKGVAKGYLNRPELDSEKFVDNPFGEGKMYRTGDLVRWLPDGNIDFIGRIDKQVKIRGFRIELEEIENVLRKYDKIRDCAVAIRSMKRTPKAICSYIVADDDFDFSELKQWAKEILPEYMIPDCYVLLNRIMVTANGKTDFKAMERIPIVETTDTAMEVEARNTFEQKVSNIWKNILGIEKVYIHDSFFEIGGNSLLVIQMQTMLKEEFGDIISIGEIFANPTIQALSEKIEYSMKESVHCEAILVSEDLFEYEDAGIRRKNTRSITGELYERIKVYMRTDAEELYSVILFNYWHILSEISLDESFYMCLGRNKEYCSLLAENIIKDDFNESKNILKDKYLAETKYENAKIQLKNKINSITPALLYGYEGKDFYTDICEFVISVSFHENEMILMSEQNSRKVNPELTIYILNELADRLEQLF